MAGMDEPPHDKAQPLETRQVLAGNMTYSVTLDPSDDNFVASWRCPVCERRQGCSHRTDTRDEAIHCMEAEVRAHHAKFHRDENSTPDRLGFSVPAVLKVGVRERVIPLGFACAAGAQA
jgi:hypothetical protein